jgi:hypothetical protein
MHEGVTDFEQMNGPLLCLPQLSMEAKEPSGSARDGPGPFLE